MFKKFRKTKMILSSTAVSALALLPVLTAVSLDTSTPSSVTPVAKPFVPIAETLSTDDGKIIKTPDRVFTVDDITMKNFSTKEDVSKLLIDEPKVMDKFMPGTSATFVKNSEPALNAAGKTALGSYNATDPEYTAFVGKTNKAKLYEALNPGMLKHAQQGTRFDFGVPSEIAGLGGYTSGDIKPKGYDFTKPFVYKVAEFDPTAIVEGETLSLDYMYEEGVGSLKKFQIDVPYSAELSTNDDSTTMKQMIENKDIFIRTMDKTDRSSDVASNISLDNSGLSIVKEKGHISLYSTLKSQDAKSAIMIDPKATKAAVAGASIGILGASTQSEGLDITPMTPKPAAGGAALPSTDNLVSDFREFTIENDWDTTSGDYIWKDGESTPVQKITMYMKTGSSFTAALTYPGFSSGSTETLEVSAPDSSAAQLEVKPLTPISIEQSKFKADDRTFEVESWHSGDWFKVTLVVKNPSTFIIGLGSGTTESAWEMKNEIFQDIFFENPTSIKFDGDPQVKTRLLQKLVDDNAIAGDAYRYVYGAWDEDNKNHGFALTAQNEEVSKALDTLGPVGSEPMWKDFSYINPHEDVTQFDATDTDKVKFSPATTMRDIITKLNEYHNNLLGIEEKHIDGFAPEEHNGVDSYFPKDTTEFSYLYTNYLLKASGTDTDAITKKIKLAIQIEKLTYSKYEYELKDWNNTTKGNNHEYYISKWIKTGPAGPAVPADAPINFIDLRKQCVDEDEFNELIKIVKPALSDELDPNKSLSGTVTISKFIQRDVEKIIPHLFDFEYETFKSNMSKINTARFAAFLGQDLSKNPVELLDSQSITNGISPVYKIHYVDVNPNPTIIQAKTGTALVKDLLQLIYKTGFYKSIFAGDVHQLKQFEKMYSSVDENKDSDLWSAVKYKVGGKEPEEMLKVMATIFEALQPKEAETFNQALGKDKSEYKAALLNMAKSAAEGLVSQNQDVDFRWTAGNEYMGTNLQKQVILTNINNVVDFLKANNAADKLLGAKLDGFIKTFTGNSESETAIAQLGPTLGIYKMDVFIPQFSNDSEGTALLVERMVSVDPLRVLIPNTGQSKTFKVLENKGGKAALGLVIGAGALILLIGTVLIGLSFTKRIVVNGRTWSIKMIIIRVALLAISIAGLYMIMTGTILPGHEALTEIVNV